jgi:hypothetical protein
MPIGLSLVFLAISSFLGWGFIRGLQTGQFFSVRAYQFDRSSQPVSYWLFQTVYLFAFVFFFAIAIIGFYFDFFGSQ